MFMYIFIFFEIAFYGVESRGLKVWIGKAMQVNRYAAPLSNPKFVRGNNAFFGEKTRKGRAENNPAPPRIIASIRRESVNYYERPL